MALTMGHHLFGGIHEDAFNKFLRTYQASRPKYFFYACPPLGLGVPGVDFWVIPPLPIPGTGSGMPISVRIVEAKIDFTPGQPGLNLPAPLVLDKNQFALFAAVQVCFLCGSLQRMPNPAGEGNRDDQQQNREPSQRDGKIHRECTKLSVWAIGHPLSLPNSFGGRDIGLRIDRIVLKDVGGLEALLECYSETMLNNLLDALRYPVERIALGAFGSLSLVDGPLIADNQLEAWADIN